MTHQMRTSRLVRAERNRTSAALVLLPRRDSDYARAGARARPTSCLGTGCHESGEAALLVVVQKGGRG